MNNSSSKNSEYGSPPEEYSVMREYDLPPVEEGFDRPMEDCPAEEFAAPAQEIIEPGTFPWTARKKSSKQAKFRSGLFLISAVVILLFAISDFSPEKTEVSSPDVPDEPPTVSVPTETEKPTEPENEEPQTPEPAPNASVPSCEIIAYAFSSEIYGDICFENMDSVSNVTLSVWDTLTNTMESSIDITEEVVISGKYHIEPFYTDIFYSAHKAEYDAAGSFPVEAELQVTIEYAVGEESLSETYSRVTPQESGWYIIYTPENGFASDWSFPECFMLMTFDSVEELTVVVDSPEKVVPGVISISGEINGESIAPENFEIRTEQTEGYYADGSTVSMYRTMVIIPRPAELPENAGNTAHFTVTQYLKSYDRVWDTEVDVEF